MSIYLDLEADLAADLEATWEEDVACQHHQHAKREAGHRGPAWALVDMTCPSCGDGHAVPLCKPAWDLAGTKGWGVTCDLCGHKTTRDEGWRIIHILRPGVAA